MSMSIIVFRVLRPRSRSGQNILQNALIHIARCPNLRILIAFENEDLDRNLQARSKTARDLQGLVTRI